MKHNHEFRDPIHVFVTLDSDERRVVDSRPFQRLRHIHQLATSFLIFPGASHKRFEHSLGVMHLAGEVFDIVTEPANLHPSVKDYMPGEHQRQYWRRVVRLAALCHDVGHLPFSHAAKHDLLPTGWNHERLTFDLIMSEEMQDIFMNSIPPIKPSHVAKVAIGTKKLSEFNSNLQLDTWETLLSEIIVGDAFGVDRVDYLLRDAYHGGVVYGRFDHHRLIQTLRILPRSNQQSSEPWLGIEVGGIEAAEAMSLARYFMYKQVYFHHVRRAYDIHLKDFLQCWLPAKMFSTDLEKHLQMTDNEVTAAMLSAARNTEAEGHIHAKRIVDRNHFKRIYERTPADLKISRHAVDNVRNALALKFGEEQIRRDSYPPRAAALDFPVILSNGEIESSINLSETLQKIPSATFDLVLCDRAILNEANRFMSESREDIIKGNRGRAMTALNQSAIVLYVMGSLRDKGSWCGETHIQKTLYMCQELTDVPSKFKFVLYKHGPYSFELSQHLQALIADDLVLVLTRPPYGPTLDISDEARTMSSEVSDHTCLTKCINFMSDKLGKKNVGDLERLATAVYINSREGVRISLDKKAEALTQIKPHVEIEAARRAFMEVDCIRSEVSDLGCGTT